jgi:hypothetical protein
MAKVEQRNCPKSLGGAYGVALRTAEKALFGPFRHFYSGQIHDRNVAQTPFRTVSPSTSMIKGKWEPGGNRANNHTPYRRSETWQNAFAQRKTETSRTGRKPPIKASFPPYM